MSLTVNTVLWHCEYIITQHNLKGEGGGGGVNGSLLVHSGMHVMHQKNYLFIRAQLYIQLTLKF